MTQLLVPVSLQEHLPNIVFTLILVQFSNFHLMFNNPVMDFRDGPYKKHIVCGESYTDKTSSRAE